MGVNQLFGCIERQYTARDHKYKFMGLVCIRLPLRKPFAFLNYPTPPSNTK